MCPLHNIAFSSEKVISSQSGEKYAQIKHCLQLRTVLNKYVTLTLDHKSSHKGIFFEIEIYTLSKSWINKLSMLCLGQYLAKIQLFENLESECAKKI